MLSVSGAKDRAAFFEKRSKNKSRRWMLKLEEVNALEPISLEEYCKNNEIEDEFVYSDKYMRVKGLRYILKSAALLLKNHDRNVTLTTDYTVATFEGYSAPSEKVKLPMSFKNGVLALQELLLTAKKLIKETSTGRTEEEFYIKFKFVPEHPAWLIMVLFAYPEFAKYYKYYLVDPDDNVEFVEFTKENMKKMMAEASVISLKKPTLEDIKVTAHGVILLLCRNFSERDPSAFETQMKNMKESRLNTARSLIGSLTGDYLFDLETVKNATKIWNFYMKLKLLVFEFASNAIDKPEIIGARGLLKGQQMAITRCMTAFCMASPGQVTLAHCNKEVIKEMKAFKSELKEITDREGDRWMFYRTLHPKEGKISIRKFPYLACAATYFYKKFVDNSEGMKKMTAPTKPQGYPNIEAEATTALSIDCYIVGEAQLTSDVYTEEDKAFMRSMKKDLDKVQENLKARGEVTPFGPKLAFEEALRIYYEEKNKK